MKYIVQKKRVGLWLLIGFIQIIKVSFILELGISSVELILLASTIEFLLYTLFLTNYYGSELLIRFLFLFSIFFYLYNHIYPYLYFFVLDISLFTWIGDQDIYKALVLSTITFSIVVQVILVQSQSLFIKKQIRNFIDRSKRRIKNIQGSPLKNAIILLVYSFFCVLALHYAIKYFSLSPEIRSSRYQVVRILGSGGGTYIKIVMIGVTGWLFLYWNNVIQHGNLKRKVKVLILSFPIILFWIAHALAANRRELVALLIFGFASYWILKRTPLKKILTTGLVLFILMILISAFRGGATQSDSSFYFNSFGEFIFPNTTLAITMDESNRSFENFKLGSTYLYPIYTLIPRSIWEEKPLTTAAQFSNDVGVDFGLGFSPLTESYMNWGWFTIFIFPVILILLFLSFLFLDKYLPFIYLFLIASVLNLNRGELGTVLLEMVIMYVPFYLLYYFSKKRIK